MTLQEFMAGETIKCCNWNSVKTFKRWGYNDLITIRTEDEKVLFVTISKNGVNLTGFEKSGNKVDVWPSVEGF